MQMIDNLKDLYSHKKIYKASKSWLQKKDVVLYGKHDSGSPDDLKRKNQKNSSNIFYSVNLNLTKSTDYQSNLTDSNSPKEVTVNQSNFTNSIPEN